MFRHYTGAMFWTAERHVAAVAAATAVVCLAALAWSLTGTGVSGRPTADRGDYVVVGGPKASGVPRSAVPGNGTVTLVPSTPAPAHAARAVSHPVPDGPAPTGVPEVPGASATHRRPPGPTAVPAPAPASRAVGPTSPPGPAGRPVSRPASGPASRPAAVPRRRPFPSSARRTPVKRAARLTVEGLRDSADPRGRRWCRNITVTYRNRGGLPVTSGRAVLRAAVVDLFGIEWASSRTAVGVPLPIAAGGRVTRTYGVCFDVWRVLPGTRVVARGIVLRG